MLSILQSRITQCCCLAVALLLMPSPATSQAAQNSPPPTLSANTNKPKKANDKKTPKYSDKDIQRVIKFLKKYRAPLAVQLEQLKKQGKKEEYNKLTTRIANKVMHLVRRSESDPNGFKLLQNEHQYNIDASAISRRLKQAKSDKDRKSLRKQLKQKLEQAYEARIKIQEYELTKVEKRLKHLREQINKQRKDRNKWIEHRLKQAEPRKSTKKPSKKENAKK